MWLPLCQLYSIGKAIPRNRVRDPPGHFLFSIPNPVLVDEYLELTFRGKELPKDIVNATVVCMCACPLVCTYVSV